MKVGIYETYFREPVCNQFLNWLVTSLSCPQVYVRRSYTAYDVTCVQHEMLDENTTIVQWQFLLPTSHPNRSPHSHHHTLTNLYTHIYVHTLHIIMFTWSHGHTQSCTYICSMNMLISHPHTLTPSQEGGLPQGQHLPPHTKGLQSQ